MLIEEEEEQSETDKKIDELLKINDKVDRLIAQNRFFYKKIEELIQQNSQRNQPGSGRGSSGRGNDYVPPKMGLKPPPKLFAAKSFRSGSEILFPENNEKEIKNNTNKPRELDLPKKTAPRQPNYSAGRNFQKPKPKTPLPAITPKASLKKAKAPAVVEVRPNSMKGLHSFGASDPEAESKKGSHLDEAEQAQSGGGGAGNDAEGGYQDDFHEMTEINFDDENTSNRN